MFHTPKVNVFNRQTNGTNTNQKSLYILTHIHHISSFPDKFSSIFIQNNTFKVLRQHPLKATPHVLVMGVV